MQSLETIGIKTSIDQGCKGGEWRQVQKPQSHRMEKLSCEHLAQNE